MSLHVLIADHHMDQVMLLAEFLLRRGLHAATCMGGHQAMEAISSHCATNQPYDLVIAHVDLPEVAGLRVLYEARRLHLETVVAVMCPAGRRDEAVESMIRKAGVSAVLDQPVDLAQIDALIRKISSARPASIDSALPPADVPQADPMTPAAPAEESVALPSVGSTPADEEPGYQRRASEFYDPNTGTLGQAAGASPQPAPAPRQREPRPEAPAAEAGPRQRPAAPANDAAPSQEEPGYTRRRSSEFFAAGSTQPTGTTRRIRRGLGGSFAPPEEERKMTCVHCGHFVVIAGNANPRDLSCTACGKMIRE